MDSTACDIKAIATELLECLVRYESFVREMRRAHGRPEPWLSSLDRPIPRIRNDNKGIYAQHFEDSAPSSPECAARSCKGEFAKPGGKLDYQKLLATELRTSTPPAMTEIELSRMARNSGPEGRERSKSPQSDTSSNSTLKITDYHYAFLKPAPITEDWTNKEADRDPASGLRYSTIQNLPRNREAACAGFDINAPILLDALNTPVPRPCAPVTPSGQPKVLWRTRSPPSSEDEGPMSELQKPASTGWHALTASERLERIERPVPGKGASKYRGVSWHSNRWRAAITHRRKLYNLGAFRTTEEAADAYDRAALELKGAHARTNFPASSYGVKWDEFDARPREKAPALKRRSPDNSPCDSPGASGSPPTDATPVQRSAKRQRAKVAQGADVLEVPMEVEGDFEVLPKAVQAENRAERAKRRAASAGGPQAHGSSAAPAMLRRLGELPTIPEDAEPEPECPTHGICTAPTPPSAPAPGQALHRSGRKKALPVRSHL